MTNANKLGRLVTYNKELSSIKLKDPLTRGFANQIWQIKYVLSLVPQGLLVSYYRRLPHIVTQPSKCDHVRSRDRSNMLYQIIKTTTMPMAIKRSKVVTYYHP